MSSDIIAELIGDTGMSADEAMKLILSVLDEDKSKAKKAAKKPKVRQVDIEYTGKVTFTCNTCSKVFNRTFITNIKDQHIHKPAPTCIYCKDNLLKREKEDLILMILSDRKDMKKMS